MDQLQSQLDKLSELTDEQVDELSASVFSEFEAVEKQPVSPQSVDALETLSTYHETINGEKARRVAQAEELSARAAEASARVRGEVEEAPAGDAPEDDESEETPVEEEEAVVADASGIVEPSAPETAETEPTAETEVPDVEDAEVVADDAAAEEPETAEPAAEVEPEDTVAPELSVAEVPAEEAPVEETAPEASTELAVDEVAEDTTSDSELAVEDVASAVEETEADASNITEETPIEPEEVQEEAPVTAAADESPVAPADRQFVAPVTVAPVAITAGADVPGYSAGSELTDMTEVAKAFQARLNSVRRVSGGGDGEQYIVASLETAYPESRRLTTDPEANAKKIDDVVGPEALVAAGGHATPIQIRYDIFGFGTDARPVRDSLPRFQADRGGITFITPPVLSSYANAVGIWTNAVDTTPGSATKNVLTVTGANTQTAVTDAITMQLQVGNFFARAWPELLARHNELAMIQHARIAEINLLTKIAAASTAVTTTNLIGFARDFLVQIKRAAAAYRSRHRIDPETQLQAIIPTWVYDAMAADLTLNMPGDNNLGVTKAEIQSFLALSNVSLVASLDQNTFGAQTGSGAALLEFPDTFTWFLFSEGSFLFLDGGTLDLGIIRDSTLVGTNDYRMFVETFEGLAFVGIESLAITSTISVNGVAAALRDTTGGATAAVIEM